MAFGDIFSASWNEYKSNFKLYSKLVFLFSFIPSLIYYAIIQYYSFKTGYVQSPGVILASISLSAILLLFTILTTIGILSSSVYKVKDFSKVKLLLKKYYLKYILLNLVFFVFLLPLFLLLIVPGIIFAVFWSFGAVVLIAENKKAREALKRSHELVRGKWWTVLGYTILLGLISAAIGLGFSIIKLPTYIWLLIDTYNNPAFYAEGVLPTIVSLIHAWVSQFANLIAQFVTVPLSLLFIKNFYLSLKKDKK
jgi:hypothetical protein